MMTKALVAFTVNSKLQEDSDAEEIPVTIFEEVHQPIPLSTSNAEVTKVEEVNPLDHLR